MKAKFSVDTKEITVESWGGEVVIKQLTIAETAKYTELLLDGKTTNDVDDKGKMTLDLQGMREATLLRVSMALVEPKYKPSELGELSGDAQEGITEISDALDNWDTPKKPKEGKTNTD